MTCYHGAQDIRVLIHGICVLKQIGIANILGNIVIPLQGRMVNGYEFAFFLYHGSTLFGAVHPRDPRDHVYVSRIP